MEAKTRRPEVAQTPGTPEAYGWCTGGRHVVHANPTQVVKALIDEIPEVRRVNIAYYSSHGVAPLLKLFSVSSAGLGLEVWGFGL